MGLNSPPTLSSSTVLPPASPLPLLREQVLPQPPLPTRKPMLYCSCRASFAFPAAEMCLSVLGPAPGTAPDRPGPASPWGAGGRAAEQWSSGPAPRAVRRACVPLEPRRARPSPGTVGQVRMPSAALIPAQQRRSQSGRSRWGGRPWHRDPAQGQEQEGQE